MGDPELELIKAIRRSRPSYHEWLCAACAHRDHAECAGACTYCTVDCSCVCRRWKVPVPVEPE